MELISAALVRSTYVCTCLRECVCVCVVYLGASTQAEHSTSAILCLLVALVYSRNNTPGMACTESWVREEAQDCEQIYTSAYRVLPWNYLDKY